MSSGHSSYAARLAAPVVQFPGPAVTASGHYAPTPVVKVRIEAAAEGHASPESEMAHLSTAALKKLGEGSYTKLHVNVPGATPTELDLEVRDPSVENLVALSSVIKAQVQAKVPMGYHMSHCALPSGDIEAYRLLFKWNDEVIKRGKFIPVPPQTKTPLYLYYHLIEIAKKLRITHILDTIPGRYQYMLRSPPSFQSDDIKKVYKNLKQGHPLRVTIANGIADSWDTLFTKNKDRINALITEIPEFESDLYARWGQELDQP
ncbi:hypothetical protein LTR70_001213 [Exophiala xenobiotica]|uniref:Uncharacterized protein n=1 Tax=Lithohypha guttulata TaxID=1690604 RepID=A0ABR0KLF3_9EURO|nr:hypothetical protein LTR24_001464 [Lithohypha guttulata]KAK5328188.1 hypothetical protein LTR70_001213 [Exophiala xenobiotica]